MGLENFSIFFNFTKFSNFCPKTDFFQDFGGKIGQICPNLSILYHFKDKNTKNVENMQKFSNFSQIFEEKLLRMRPTRQNLFLKNRIKRANFGW